MRFDYDIIVVGAGHAGCEAATAAARLGSDTLLITMDMEKVAQMSCNPAVGGIAKGQIVREVDALGGQMGVITDKSTIQFRMLNRSKGAAMWSPRAQCDRYQFSNLWRNVIDNTENLSMWQDNVVSLIIDQGKVIGVKTILDVEFRAKAVILTNGTFLGGQIYVGTAQTEGGRAGDSSSYGLSKQLETLGFEVARMKTGTPVRLDSRTIDFSVMERQDGDTEPEKFSLLNDIHPVENQIPCYLTYTSHKVHDILRTGFDRSPMFTGIIQGLGPRYCPSIEDKLRVFSEKEQHQLFLEPESRTTNEYYLNGFSSSLPIEVQIAALKRIPGLEKVQVYKPGYAIEYDYFPPTQLLHSLETKEIANLFFAGQINGTTGYEEAAAQGLVAGINAHNKLNDKSPLIFGRDQAYIGVLIDDLVTKGVDEPYRMFTSRAEYRILLRQDNADIRLTAIGRELGLVTDQRWKEFKEREERISKINHFFLHNSITPEQTKQFFTAKGQPNITQKRRINEVLLRNGVTIENLSECSVEIMEFLTQIGATKAELNSVEIEVKYAGYIEREHLQADKLRRLEEIRINPEFDFSSLKSLSIESRQKLSRIRPTTIAQASRIPGVSPSDINVLLVYFGR